MPGLTEVDLVDVTAARVRTWRAGLLAAGIGPSTVAGAYRLLRAVMNTALDDELIRRRNPCPITGAHQDHSPERLTASVEHGYAIADAIKPWCQRSCSRRRRPGCDGAGCTVSVAGTSTWPRGS